MERRRVRENVSDRACILDRRSLLDRTVSRNRWQQLYPTDSALMKWWSGHQWPNGTQSEC